MRAIDVAKGKAGMLQTQANAREEARGELHSVNAGLNKHTDNDDHQTSCQPGKLCLTRTKMAPP